jgi:hypothetical protein
MKTAKYRQHVAETIYQGLLRFFEDRDRDGSQLAASSVR